MRKPTSFKLNPHIKREIVFGSGGSSVEPFAEMPSDPTGRIFVRGDGQSNMKGASFNEVPAGFTEIINSTKTKVIRGTSPPLTTYDNPRSQTYLGTPQLNDGTYITDDQSPVLWSTPDDYDLFNKLVDLIVTNKTNVTDVTIMPAAMGGTSVGSHINDANFDLNATWGSRGGLFNVKNRALTYHNENYETGGVAPDYDWKCFIWWQGENEFLELARGYEARSYADNARDALHSAFESAGVYDYYDAIIEIQPVWVEDIGYYNTTSFATWQSEYAYIKSSYQSKAESQPKTKWLDIQTVLDNADYQLASSHGAGGFNQCLHLNPAGYYQVGQMVYNLATGVS